MSTKKDNLSQQSKNDDMFSTLTALDDAQFVLLNGIKTLGILHTAVAEGIVRENDANDALQFIFTSLYDIGENISLNVTRAWKDAGFRT